MHLEPLKTGATAADYINSFVQGITSLRQTGRTSMDFRNSWRLKLVVILIAFGLGWPAAAGACSCAQRLLADHFKAAEVVFFGTVIDVSSNEQGQVAHLKVVQSWKGVYSVGSSVAISSPSPHGACGLPFKSGTGFLIFGSGAFSSAGMSATICNGSRGAEAGDPVLSELDGLEKRP